MIHSETAKEHESLYRFLLENEEITDETIDSLLSPTDQLTLNDLLPRIINLCQEEWKGDETLLNPVEILEGEKRIRCSLCNTPNKEIYYITNRISRKKLNVGSTCIDEFAMESLKDGKSKAQLVKDAKRTLRLKNISSRFPGIEKELSSWDDRLAEFRLLIPIELESKYLELGNSLRNNYNNYLDEKIGNSALDSIGELLKSKGELLQRMSEYCIEHEGKKYVITRDVVNWLNRKNDTDTVLRLKETGYLTWSTAGRVFEPIILRQIIDDYEPHFRKERITVQSIDLSKELLILSPFSDSDLLLSCRLHSFLENFGWLLLNDSSNRTKPAFIRNNIIKLSRLHGRESSNIAIFEMNRKISPRSMVTIRVDDYNGAYDHHEFNELDLFDRRKNLVVVVNMSDFLDEFKNPAFDEKVRDVTDKLVGYVDALSKDTTMKWYTREQLKEIRTTDIRKKAK
jgi:LSD1 subclass zinc finger protein